VYGNRIADHGIHASRLQVVEKLVALFGTDGQQMEYVLFAFGPRLKLEWQIGQSLAILMGDLSSLLVPLVQARQLPGQNLCLNGIEFGVVARVKVIVLACLTQGPQRGEPFFYVRSIGSDCATIAGSG